MSRLNPNTNVKFSITLNRWAVFYFFIQNLSEWHFSNRKEYNILWEKELGPFSKEEKSTLKKFGEVHKCYPFGKNYLGRHFFLESDSWKVLEKEMTKSDFSVIKKTFSLFKEKFSKFYSQELPLMKKWQNTLQKKLNDKNLNSSINLTLTKLYDTSLLSKNITVYILPSSESRIGGTGGIIDDKSVTLEISRYPVEGINRAIGIIWHEIIHLYFEKQSFIQTLKEKYPDDPDTISLVKETAASSLFPNGVLGSKFLNNESDSLNVNIPQKYTGKLIKLAKNYIEKNKSLDNEYIKRVYSLIYGLKGRLK